MQCKSITLIIVDCFITDTEDKLKGYEEEVRSLLITKLKLRSDRHPTSMRNGLHHR